MTDLPPTCPRCTACPAEPLHVHLCSGRSAHAPSAIRSLLVLAAVVNLVCALLWWWWAR